MVSRLSCYEEIKMPFAFVATLLSFAPFDAKDGL